MDLTIMGIFGAGLLTFFSPCVLPMVPIIAANYLLAGNDSRFARLKSTALFSLGFLFTFTLMGLSLPFVSDFLGDAKGILLIISAAFIFLYGLKMSGMAFKNAEESRLLAWMGRSAYLPNLQKRLPKSLHGLLFGATFGLAWTPCVGPILGGVLTYVATKDRSLLESVVLMVSFASGIVVPFIALAIGGDLVQGQFNKLKKYLPKIEEYTGYALMFVAFMIFTQSSFPRIFSAAEDETQIAFTTPQGKTTLEQVAPGANKLLFFHTNHCPVCHQMETFMPALEKECTSANFQIVRINVELPENQAIANKFKVMAVPTMSLLSADGQELAHTVGYQSETGLRKAINLLPKMACASVLPTPENKQTSPIPEGKTCDKESNGLTC